MTDDERLAAMRARAAIAARFGAVDPRWASGPAFHAHEDRATLLGMVEALRRERDEARASEGRLRGALRNVVEDPHNDFAVTPSWLEIARAALAASERGS